MSDPDFNENYKRDICAAMIYLCDENYALYWDAIYLFWARKTNFTDQDAKCALAAIDRLPEDIDALDTIFHVVRHTSPSGKLLEHAMTKALQLPQSGVLSQFSRHYKSLPKQPDGEFCTAFKTYLKNKTTWIDCCFDVEMILTLKRRCGK